MKPYNTHTNAMKALSIMCILLMGYSASANTTNTIPFADSFEGLTNFASIVGTNGWYAPTNSYAIATNVTYSYSGNQPLSTTHNTHITLDTENGSLTNLINDTTSSDVWIDMMLLPTRWTDETYPDMSDVAIDFAMFVDSNGNPVVYHHNGTTSNVYSTLTGFTLDSNTWTRLTITASNLFSFGVFAVQFDGGSAISHANGYQSDGVSQPGPWFYEANSFKAKGITSIAFSGTGFLDDFVVTNSAPVFSIMWAITASINNALGGSVSPSGTFMVNDGVTTSVTITVSNFWEVSDVAIDSSSAGTPLLVTFTNVQAPHTVDVTVVEQMATNGTGVSMPRWWLASYVGPTSTNNSDTVVDSDGDTLTNWQEWLASTDPTNTLSTFEIIQHYVQNGTGFVVWVSKAVDPTLPPFAVYRSTNITETAGGWSLVDGNVSRPVGEGTNVWQDPTPPGAGVPVYYRVSATN